MNEWRINEWLNELVNENGMKEWNEEMNGIKEMNGMNVEWINEWLSKLVNKNGMNEWN